MKLNKKQKRTATIASMAALLAVVLGMGGQTFAKYITTNTADPQSATVAKWGLVLNQKTTGETLFKKDYDGSVVSTEHTVVAPGTSGSITYLVTGYAEVDAQVTFSLESYSGVSLKQGTTVDYNPVKWTYQVKGGSETPFTPVTGYEFSPITYQASNTEWTTSNSEIEITIKWAWEIETGTSDSEKEQNNKYDTIMGYAAKAEDTSFNYSSATYQEGDNLDYEVDYTLDFQFKAKIEQID